MAGVSRIAELEGRIQEAYARLSEAAAVARYCHEHYLDDLTRAMPGNGDGDPFATVTELAAAHPWALGGFHTQEWDRYQPDQQAAAPDGLRVGVLADGLGGGLPPMPAVARLAGRGHVLITEDRSPDVARSLLQALALRLAVATRPGSVRFALVDPMGQGRHLSAFLRLPAALMRVGTSVAASEHEIEALLKTLAEHVVEVTQRRLTNVYGSIEEYNAATTGATVPYYVLVLAGFPAHFTDRSATLLASLAENGPRAGVYLIGTVVTGQQMPRDFDLAALTSRATNLEVTSAGMMTWDDLEFAGSAIKPDQMPAAGRANPWLDKVAEAARESSQDLSFERIAVPDELRWRGNSTDGLRIQIGIDSRGEPQYFVMGADGVHHGLVGGDTRMGKTNLLHVLIHQLTLQYPPEELELYLLDFRTVEFDAYLRERLPHCRAVTMRADREFGLSMLRKLHKEIERREELCLRSGTTTLPEYRQETGQVLPRALAIMDEFQVMFATEDRIAREAAFLLTDIAKRGAAVGLHLLLSTQSPAGTYVGLLREAYSQMPLRIALGCKEPRVSQAILSEGNDSATRLTRPGDAIYNARGGEGVNPQIRIAALPNRDRRLWIADIAALGANREYRPPDTFDPGAPADFATHPAVAAFAAHPGQWPDSESALAGSAPVVAAWLGEAVEIKPPTSAVFEHDTGYNLLIVGDADNGHALLLATLLSVAVQLSPADVSFTITEFARRSSPFHGFFAPLANLHHDVVIHGARAANAGLDDVLADLDRRLASADGPPAPACFYLIAGLQWWQEAVTGDEYGRASETAKKLDLLLDKGSDVGIHVVAWADSYATLRSVFKQSFGRFGLRAVLRVSTTSESDNLLGVGTAADLEDNRALFRDAYWQRERTEKFKPYSLDSLRAFTQVISGGHDE